MTRAKIAITIPEELLAVVDAAAEDSGDSRSGYITRVLRVATRARNDAEITRRLNQVFGQPGVGEEQLRVAEEMDSAGSDGSDEPW